MPRSPMRPRAACAARLLAAIAMSVSLAHAASSDDALRVLPGSPILAGLETMAAGDDIAAIFETREVYRLARRDDAVAAIDRHLEAIALARQGKAPAPAARTYGEIIRGGTGAEEPAAVMERARTLREANWQGEDRAGIERARRWLGEVGCERRGACGLAVRPGWDTPGLRIGAGAAAAGVVTALLFGLVLRRRRMTAALGFSFVATAGVLLLPFAIAPAKDAMLVLVVLVFGYAPLVLPAYFVALVATLALLRRWRPDKVNRMAA